MFINIYFRFDFNFLIANLLKLHDIKAMHVFVFSLIRGKPKPFVIRAVYLCGIGTVLNTISMLTYKVMKQFRYSYTTFIFKELCFIGVNGFVLVPFTGMLKFMLFQLFKQLKKYLIYI